MSISTGVVQVPQALKTPMMEEVIAFMTAYNIGANRNHCIFIRTGIDCTTPDPSSSGSSAVANCPSPNPSYACIWKVIIGNIRKNNTPNFRKSSYWTFPLTEDLPIILFCLLSGVGYSVMNYLTVPVGISTHAVGWTSWLSLSKPWDHNSLSMGSYHWHLGLTCWYLDPW